MHWPTVALLAALIVRVDAGVYTDVFFYPRMYFFRLLHTTIAPGECRLNVTHAATIDSAAHSNGRLAAAVAAVDALVRRCGGSVRTSSAMRHRAPSAACALDVNVRLYAPVEQCTERCLYNSRANRDRKCLAGERQCAHSHVADGLRNAGYQWTHSEFLRPSPGDHINTGKVLVDGRPYCHLGTVVKCSEVSEFANDPQRRR